MTRADRDQFGRGPAPGWLSIYRVNQDWLVDVATRYPAVLLDLAQCPFHGLPRDRDEHLHEIHWLRNFCRGQRLHSDLVLKAAYATVTAWQRDPSTRGRGDE